jgi:predicted lipid-binding transport protein (Tim44 family)
LFWSNDNKQLINDKDTAILSFIEVEKKMNLDIIVLLVVVVLIFQRLWKVLGARPDEESHKIKLSREGAEKLYNLLRSEGAKVVPDPDFDTEELVPLEDGKPLTEPEKTLRQIPQFDKAVFLRGAKKAFQIITEAFNSGDSQTLEMLVDADILHKMQAVIKQRQQDKITAETDFIGFEDVEITKAHIENDKAYVVVKFTSEQVNVLRNADNEIIEGDENYIQNITDIWTFERKLDSKSLNWLLSSTKKS